MKPRRPSFFAFLLLGAFAFFAFFLGACRGGAPTEPVPPPSATVAGAWETSEGRTVLALVLRDSTAGRVSATGSVNSIYGALAVAGSGAFVDGDLVLLLKPGNFDPFVLGARLVGDDTLRGSLSGSGLVDEPVALVRVRRGQ